MAGDAEMQKSGSRNISYGRLFVASQFHPLRRLSPAHERQTWPGWRHHSHGAQDCRYRLRHGEKPCAPYDETRWAEYEALRKMRIEAKLHSQARRLGYQLVPLQQPAS